MIILTKNFTERLRNALEQIGNELERRYPQIKELCKIANVTIEDWVHGKLTDMVPELDDKYIRLDIISAGIGANDTWIELIINELQSYATYEPLRVIYVRYERTHEDKVFIIKVFNTRKRIKHVW